MTNKVSAETIKRRWTGLTCYVTGELLTVAFITVGTNASLDFFFLRDQSFRCLCVSRKYVMIAGE